MPKEIAVLTLTLTLGVVVASGLWCEPRGPCRTCQFVSVERDQHDCNRYYLCHLGRMWSGFRCSPNQMYSMAHKGCVISRDSDECLQREVVASWRYTPPDSKPHTTTSTSGLFTQQQQTTSSDKRRQDVIRQFPGDERGQRLSDQCGIKMSRNIVGGQEAGNTEWLWQVSLQYYNSSQRAFVHGCGGTLVHPSWVLTAAHCVFEKRRNFDIRRSLKLIVGEYRLDGIDPWEQRLTASKVILHPGYLPYGSYPNDIALVKLRRPITKSSAIRPVCLPSNGSSPSDRDPDGRTTGCWVTGWGYTLGSSDRETLNEIKMQTVSRQLCRRIWPGYIGPTQMCARAEDRRGVGACKGDSGGPLVCTRGGRFYIEGVVSWGEDTCLRKGYPNVFTQVSLYVDWIRQQIQQDSHVDF